MRAEIRALQKSLGITSIYVTHDQEEAMSVSDRIGLMNAGRLEQVGTPTDIYRKPASRFAAEFMGTTTLVEARQLGLAAPVTVSLRPEALAEDCAQAQVVVSAVAAGCRGPGVLIDRNAAAAGEGYQVTLSPLTAQSVRQSRGERPWLPKISIYE